MCFKTYNYKYSNTTKQKITITNSRLKKKKNEIKNRQVSTFRVFYFLAEL